MPFRFNRSSLATIAFLAFAAALAGFVFSLELDKRLDDLCEKTSWQKCAALLDEDIRFWNNRPRAMLKQYFLELAAAQPMSKQDGRPNLADLQESSDGGRCADSLRGMAKTLEYDEYLPHLAEACIRCAVATYRHRFQLSAGLSFAEQDRRRMDLVRGLRMLSELYRNHNKPYIAERALAESKQVEGGK